MILKRMFININNKNFLAINMKDANDFVFEINPKNKNSTIAYLNNFLKKQNFIKENDKIKFDEIVNNIYINNKANQDKLNYIWNYNNLKHISNITNLLDNVNNKTIQREQYKKLVEMFTDFFNMNDELNNLPILMEIAYKLSINNLELWKKFCDSIFVNSNNLDVNSIKMSMKILINYIERFNFSESRKSFSRYYFYYDENNLRQIISFFQINSFLKIFSERFIAFKDNEYYDIVELVYNFTNIINKYTKISNLNSIEKINFFNKFYESIAKNINYDLYNNDKLILVLKTYSIIIQNCYDRKEFVKIYHNICSKIKINNDHKEKIKFILDVTYVWKAISGYDKEFYEKKFRNLLLLTFKFNYKNYYSLTVFNNLSSSLIKDDLLYKHLLSSISKLNWKNIYLFQRNSFHISLEYMVYKNIINNNFLNNLNLKYLRGILNYHCLSSKIKNIPKINNNYLITDKQDNIDYCDKDNYIKNNPNYIKNLNKDQIYYNGGLEKVYKQCLLHNLPKIFKNYKIEFIDEEKFCQFRWDLSIYFLDFNKKIGLEFSGLNYKLYSGKFHGKKIIKFELSEKNNFDYLLFEIEKEEENLNLLQNINNDNSITLASHMSIRIKDYFIKKYNIDLVLNIEK